MEPKAPRAVLATILTMALAAGVIVVIECRDRSAEESRRQEFQQLVGGLGFGPAADLERCEFSFDPRLCSACPNDVGPIPGGMCFCPYHACSVVAYPPLRSGTDQGPPPDETLP